MNFIYFQAPFTKDELKKQFKENCKKYHPDMPTGHADKFKAMYDEFEKISDMIATGGKQKPKIKPLHYNGSTRVVYIRRRQPIKIKLTDKEKTFINDLRDFAVDILQSKIQEWASKAKR